MTSRHRLPWSLATPLLALCAAGCNSDFTYQPAENATALIHGRTAADYQIPAAKPTGDVRIASFGFSKLTPKTATVTQEIRAMHVRMIVSNMSPQPWVVDTRDQLAAVRGSAEVQPVFARSDAQDLPVVTIAPGGQRTIDLFFPLPAAEQQARKLPSFDVVWRVRTGTQLVTERTPFERLYIAPVYAGYWYPYAFGPYGWYDPIWGPGIIGTPGWYW
jgi:hypothetical protein